MPQLTTRKKKTRSSPGPAQFKNYFALFSPPSCKSINWQTDGRPRGHRRILIIFVSFNWGLWLSVALAKHHQPLSLSSTISSISISGPAKPIRKREKRNSNNSNYDECFASTLCNLLRELKQLQKLQRGTWKETNAFRHFFSYFLASLASFCARFKLSVEQKPNGTIFLVMVKQEAIWIYQSQSHNLSGHMMPTNAKDKRNSFLFLIAF